MGAHKLMRDKTADRNVSSSFFFDQNMNSVNFEDLNYYYWPSFLSRYTYFLHFNQLTNCSVQFFCKLETFLLIALLISQFRLTILREY